MIENPVLRYFDSVYSKISGWISKVWQKETGISRIPLSIFIIRAGILLDIAESAWQGYSFLVVISFFGFVIWEIGMVKGAKQAMDEEEKQENSDEKTMNPFVERLKRGKSIFCLLGITHWILFPLTLLGGLDRFVSGAVDWTSGNLLVVGFYVLISDFIPRGKRISAIAPAPQEVAHASTHS